MSQYKYNSTDLVKPIELTAREEFLLKDSKTFCIYPWIHIHAYPTGEAYPCCHAEMGVGQVGNCRTQTLKEIWYGDPMNELRVNMLQERKSVACQRCYEQEEAGFFSGRKSANKHHGHHIGNLQGTPFEMSYWDIRFSNLCNLSCRSCGHIFSSSWYQDQVKLAGEDWAKKNRPLNIAGRDPSDMWNQLIPHLDYVEQIYFAGGEPLMMEEHYRILEELERRERFDVRLIYNTNFTHVKLKDRVVFDYWKKFKSVAVGASLDAMGPRAEYIRKGTDWDQVERNREQMIELCPNVDFYVSPTLSIMNAWHLPDFHRNWTERGLINAQDLNVNILQDPAYYRIDIAPMKYKQRLRIKFEEHLDWLRPQDKLQRATVGFESAVKFMLATDNTQLIDTFWRKTHQLDNIRDEKLLDIIKELEALL
jgi:MoaA/NifB/PqqE/SkfB family radical SAM enzyme